MFRPRRLVFILIPPWLLDVQFSGGCGFEKGNSPLPQLPIQAPISNRLRHMPLLQVLRTVQVGDGAGHAQDAVVGAGAKAQAFHGSAEEGLARLIQDAELAELAAAHAAVEARAARA